MNTHRRAAFSLAAVRAQLVVMTRPPFSKAISQDDHIRGHPPLQLHLAEAKFGRQLLSFVTRTSLSHLTNERFELLCPRVLQCTFDVVIEVSFLNAASHEMLRITSALKSRTPHLLQNPQSGRRDTFRLAARLGRAANSDLMTQHHPDHRRTPKRSEALAAGHGGTPMRGRVA
jgi:hypothetical protein